MNSTPRDHLFEAFTGLFLDEHNDPDLEEVFSLLCQIFDPECHASLLGDELDALAKSVTNKNPQGIIEVLFSSGLLVGDKLQYDHPHNSLPHKVLTSGRGLPITLCVIAILVSRRCGINLWGVGLPGHFVLGTNASDQTEYFDPFNGGLPLTQDQCLAIASMSGGLTGDADDILQPTTTRAVVIRTLNNLTQSYRRRSDMVGLQAVVALRLVVPELCRIDQKSTFALLRELN